jgi:predicted PurR-regulated permease PerM
MENTLKPPLYLKLVQITCGLLAFFYILYIGGEILVPLLFATIFAILLNPVINFLCSKGMNRIAAIVLTLTVAFLLFIGIFYFISSQAMLFGKSFPLLKQKFFSFLQQTSDWVAKTFKISHRNVDKKLEEMKGDGLDYATTLLGSSLSSATEAFILLLLLPVYIFLILFYKPLLLQFIARLFDSHDHPVVVEVLQETKSLIQAYLVGLILEAGIIAVLNSVALLALGIEYAILLGIIGAILNVIPYIGGIIAVALPMLLAFATKTPLTAFWVLVLYTLIQFVDNHYIVPKVVASKVKINALASIVVVLCGGALWGTSGMFLSIPLVAIMKVIFDHVPCLNPFGYLLGDDQPHVGTVIFDFEKMRKRTKK